LGANPVLLSCTSKSISAGIFQDLNTLKDFIRFVLKVKIYLKDNRLPGTIVCDEFHGLVNFLSD
jgi:hypothetical protein